MASIAWHEESTKRRVEALVRAVEAKSSAEVVVTVRARSGSYRAADLLCGAILAFVGLCVYVYAPIEFTDDLAPPAIALLFASGAMFSSRVPAVRRLLTRRAELAGNVRAAARAAFVDQGITCTRDRTGILLFVSMFERRAEVVADIGIVRREDEQGPARQIAEIERVVSAGGDLEALEKAALELGVWLGNALPPRLDDTNELADEVNVS